MLIFPTQNRSLRPTRQPHASHNTPLSATHSPLCSDLSTSASLHVPEHPTFWDRSTCRITRRGGSQPDHTSWHSSSLRQSRENGRGYRSEFRHGRTRAIQRQRDETTQISKEDKISFTVSVSRTIHVDPRCRFRPRRSTLARYTTRQSRTSQPQYWCRRRYRLASISCSSSRRYEWRHGTSIRPFGNGGRG